MLGRRTSDERKAVPVLQAHADEALVRSLFQEHGRAMLAYATHLTRDRATAEDVVQEALVRAWRHPDSVNNSKGSVRGWLLTVVRNLVTDQIRARNRRAPEVPEAAVDAAVADDHAVLRRPPQAGRLPRRHRPGDPSAPRHVTAAPGIR